MDILIPLSIGLMAGVSSGLFGIGGGIIIVPLVAFFFKFPQQSVVATSLVALLLPVGSLGVWQYYSQGFLTMTQVKLGLMIALGMLLGTLGGAKIASNLSGELLTKLFSIFLVIVAIRLWWSSSN